MKKIFEALELLNPNWVEKRETEISAYCKSIESVDDDGNDNDGSNNLGNEVKDLKREFSSFKTDFVHIHRGVSMASLDVSPPNTEVTELKREIHNLKIDLRNIHQVLRQKLDLDVRSIFVDDRLKTAKSPRLPSSLMIGSMSNHDRIEKEVSPGSSTIFDDDRFETVKRPRLPSSSSMVRSMSNDDRLETGFNPGESPSSLSMARDQSQNERKGVFVRI